LLFAKITQQVARQAKALAAQFVVSPAAFLQAALAIHLPNHAADLRVVQ